MNDRMNECINYAIGLSQVSQSVSLSSQPVQMLSITVKTRTQAHPFSGFRLIGFLISGILGEISLKVFLSVLNFLLLKKCKGFTSYDEIQNSERKLNLRHTTLENKYRDLSAIPQ